MNERVRRAGSTRRGPRLIVLAWLAWSAVACGLPSTPRAAAAQDPPRGPLPEKVVFDTMGEVDETGRAFYYFRSEHLGADRLLTAAQEVLGHEFVSEPSSRWIPWDMVAVLYDTPARIRKTLEVLRRFEALEAAKVTPRQVSVQEYLARFVSANELAETARGLGKRATVVESRNAVLLQGSAEAIAEIRALFERLDAAPPQARVTCWLLRGLSGPAAAASPNAASEEIPVPADLSKHLVPLVPFDRVVGVASAVVEVAVRPGIAAYLRLGGGEFEFGIEMKPAAFDPTGNTLTVQSCSVSRLEMWAPAGGAAEEKRMMLLSTGLVLREGEWVVVGAAGQQQHLVALRLEPSGK